VPLQLGELIRRKLVPLNRRIDRILRPRQSLTSALATLGAAATQSPHPA
jgi:hypothetical protein